jgi:hypothetical protein
MLRMDVVAFLLVVAFFAAMLLLTEGFDRV